MQRIIEYLLALFIFLIPWQARVVIRAGELNSGFWEYGTISLYVTDILFFTILFFFGVWVIQQWLKSPITNYQFPNNFQFPISKHFIGYWVLGIGYLVLSIFWSSDRLIAAYTVAKIIEGLLLLVVIHFLIRSDQKSDGWFSGHLLVVSFIASAGVQGALATYQFLTQSIVSWPWSGIAPQNAADLGVSVVQFADERWLRAYGSFPHPNLLGGFLALALLIITPSIPLILRGRRWHRILLVTSYLLLVTGLFFSFSRAAWIAAIVGLIIWLWESGSWRERIVKQTIVLVTGYALLVTLIYFPLVRTRLWSSERLEVKSTTERVSGYSEAWQLIKRHPIVGVGIGNYTKAVHDELRPNNPAWSYQPVHNVFVLVLAELGALGIGFLALSFLLFYRRSSEVEPPLGGSTSRHSPFSILLPLLLLLSLDHSFWTLHAGTLVFFTFLALFTHIHTESTGTVPWETSAI